MLHSQVENKQEWYFYRFSSIQLIRPMTLTGTISPILAGTGIAALNGPIRIDIFIVLLIAALLVQSATNMFNDYYDFLNGQDQDKWGTDRTTAHGPPHAAILIAARIMIGMAIILGIWLAFQSGIWVIGVGILGITFGYFYSAGAKPLCSIGLGELVAFIFLGLTTTILGYCVQGYSVDFRIIAVALPFALLISSMILTNNIRDIDKDHKFRHTLATMLGRTRAVYLLTAILAFAYVIIIGLVLYGLIPWTSAIVVFAFPLAYRLRWSFRLSAKRSEEMKGMKWAALHHWAFGLLLAIGLWTGTIW